jgi:hypothetical protein
LRLACICWESAGAGAPSLHRRNAFLRDYAALDAAC